MYNLPIQIRKYILLSRYLLALWKSAWYLVIATSVDRLTKNTYTNIKF